MTPSDVITRFLAGIGRPEEAAFYLRLFQSEPQTPFAIIAPDADVRANAFDALTADIHFLKRLGLELIEATPADDLLALARESGVKKVVYVGARRGLIPTDRPMPSFVDLTTEYDSLMAPGVLPNNQRDVLAEAQRLVDGSPSGQLTVAITSPIGLLRELFTVRGDGTLIRRGAVVRAYRTYDQLDSSRLSGMIASAFGKAPADTLFTRNVCAVYVADDYRGACIVEPTCVGAYLSKFAVDRRARGEGIGRDLWHAMRAAHPALYWRSRPNNPIASWYAEHCDGMVRGEAWHVYWRGLDISKIPAAIERALAAPVDFIPSNA